MLGYAPDLVLGALLAVIALAQFVLGLVSDGPVWRAVIAMLAALFFLWQAEGEGAAGARAGAVLPAFYTLVARLIH